jgi:sialate O-acetylesterase
MRLLVLAAIALPLAGQDLRLPALFSDHMVLQRDQKVAVWGWGAPGKHVQISSSWGDDARAHVSSTGAWSTTLKTPGASVDQKLTVTCDDATRVFNDVAIGDVWLCSGQSNMEWRLNQTRKPGQTEEDFMKELGPTDIPGVRLFTVQNAIAPAPKSDVAGTWARSDQSAALGFSACGFLFGRKIHQEVGVPVGLIASDWGGTVCESWTSRGALEKHGQFEAGLTAVAQLASGQNAAERAQKKALATWWKQLDGDLQWTSDRFDASGWDELTTPGIWESKQIGAFDGVVLMRHKFDVPAAWAGKDLTLELGPVDDMDTTWFNGEKVGGMERPGFWNVPRRYVVPGRLVKAGKNIIGVRCIDTGGGGGFVGGKDAMRLRRNDDDTQPISLAGTWQCQKTKSMSELPPMPASTRFGPNQPTALYNGMIAPLVPFGLKGFLWYQGESNRTRGFQYRTLFPAMISDWREKFGQGDLPFYFVQIAPYNYGGGSGQAAELREAQMMTLSLKNTGMAVTMDIGNPRDIHPKNKRDVGDRLARWALAKDYGKDVAYSGPAYAGMEVEGNTIRLRFQHAAGLTARGGAPSHFQVAGADGKFVAATAKIDGESILVSSPAISSPAAVRYAWGAADEPNLFNGAGLPASSFRTDDLPRSIRRR